MIMITLTEAIKKEKVFVEWLNTLKSKTYQQKGVAQMKRFIQFLNEEYPNRKVTCVTDLLELRRLQDKTDDPKEKHWIADRIPEYVEYQIRKFKVSNNSALINTNPLRGFFAYHRYPLHIRKDAMPRKQDVASDHRFTLDQLQRMVKFADARERAILLTGKDLGLRVGDFIQLERKLITSQIERAKLEGKEVKYPLEFKTITEKTKAIARCHLTKESVEALLTYWESEPTSKYWFNNDGKGHISQGQLNYVLRKLWSVAYNDPKVFDPPLGIGEKTTGRLRWHGLRDFLISALANSGANSWTIKLMTGKKVSDDMKNYLDGLDLREIYANAETRIVLGGLTNHNHSKLSIIETDVKDLKTTISSQQLQIRQLNLTVDALTDDLEDAKRDAKLLRGLYKKVTKLKEEGKL